MAEKAKSRWRQIVTYVTLIALALLIYLSWDQIQDTIDNFGRVHISILTALVIWKAVAFHGYTALYQDLFGILGKRIKYWPMYKVSLEMNFVNSVFPSGGVTGFSYFGLRMKSFGISVGKSTLVQLLRFVTTFISFQFLIFIALLILAIFGDASNFMILIASSLATLLFVGTAILTYIIESRRRIDSFFTFMTKALNRVIQIVSPKNPEAISIMAARKMFFDLHDNWLVVKKNFSKLKMPFANITIANVGELAALYTVFLAFGEAVNPGALIIAYAIANFAGLISVLPGGIGIYEGLMVTVFAAAGVSPAITIPAIIMYRIVTMVIQLPIGYYYYHKTINSPSGI